MKLVTFLQDGNQRLGAQTEDGGVLDLALAARAVNLAPDALTSMQALIEAGPAGLDTARAALRADPAEARLADAQLLAPLPRPVQIRDFMCFETHVRQASFAASKIRAAQLPDADAALARLEAAGPQRPDPVWYEQPVYYKANRFAVAGTGTDVNWPSYSKVMDYELEFAAIIGTGGRDITEDRARSHIFGYTIYNDFSARDAQAREMAGRLGPAKGKDFDNGTILGPCIVTADELTDPYCLEMTAHVSGECWTRENSGSIHWTFEQMIAHVSRSETLYPGEVLGSGTVGNGCGLERMRFLKHNDVVELSVEGIGTIRNRVVAPHNAE